MRILAKCAVFGLIAGFIFAATDYAYTLYGYIVLGTLAAIGLALIVADEVGE